MDKWSQDEAESFFCKLQLTILFLEWLIDATARDPLDLDIHQKAKELLDEVSAPAPTPAVPPAA